MNSDHVITKTRVVVAALSVAIAVVLSACSGGGGGTAQTGGGTAQTGGGGTAQTDIANPTVSLASLDSTGRANAITTVEKASAAKPVGGSVTQSSNTDSGGITTDEVEVTATYGANGPSFEVENGNSWSISSQDGNPRRIVGTIAPWQGVELNKQIPGGELWVDVYTDIEVPQSKPASGSNAGTQDVQLGTMVASAGINLNAGNNVQGWPGTLNGMAGTLDCTSTADTSCTISQGVATAGMWTFTPERPPDALDISGVAGVMFTGEFNSARTDGTYNGQVGYFKCLSNECGHESTNGMITSLTGQWVFVPTTGSTSVPDTDYLAGGLWLIIPDDATSVDDFVFGAFADGSDPFVQSNLQALTGTANYEGDATGLYTSKGPDEEVGGFFDASVSLTASFGASDALGTIDGSVTNIFVDDEPISGSLTLNPADIGTSNSGFFRSTLQGDATGITNWAGNWGGQFFGNGASASDPPGSVAGTLGGTGTDSSTSASVSFVGVFGAHKQ